MASIEDISATGDLRATLIVMDEPELMAQQIIQEGATHALTTLLAHGCTEQTVQDMLASLRSNMLVIEAVAREKGFRRLFADEDDQPEPIADPDHGRALCLAALDALSVLMTGDPNKDSPQGKALEMLSKGIEAYERATLPPPFGNAAAPTPPPAPPAEIQWQRRHTSFAEDWQVCTQAEAERVTGLRSWDVRSINVPATALTSSQAAPPDSSHPQFIAGFAEGHREASARYAQAATEQSLGLYATQAEAIKSLLDLHAPQTSGNLQERVAQVLCVALHVNASDAMDRGAPQGVEATEMLGVLRELVASHFCSIESPLPDEEGLMAHAKMAAAWKSALDILDRARALASAIPAKKENE